MIRKITNKDTKDVLKVLSKEPAYNLFAIGDIEIYGCEGDLVEVWAEYEGNEIIGVLLRYNTAFLVYYTKDDVSVEGFAEIISSHPIDKEFVSGKGEFVEKIEKHIKYKEYKKLFFCKLDKPIDENSFDDSDVQIAKIEDAQNICDLQNSIEEFSSVATVERITRNIEDGFGRIYCIKNSEGQIISMAQTTAENSTAAMIIGVCTHIDYRKQGLMRKVMLKLCYDLQQDNKLTCLFYDNKDAGRIYHSMGFETMGMWHMLSISK